MEWPKESNIFPSITWLSSVRTTFSYGNIVSCSFLKGGNLQFIQSFRLVTFLLPS
ncbi:hypothetical protein V6Z12_D01G146500 [Gossypium hirsutum]